MRVYTYIYIYIYLFIHIFISIYICISTYIYRYLAEDGGLAAEVFLEVGVERRARVHRPLHRYLPNGGVKAQSKPGQAHSKLYKRLETLQKDAGITQLKARTCIESNKEEEGSLP